MANDNSPLVAPSSSTPSGPRTKASGSRNSNEAGMPHTRRRPNIRKSPRKRKKQPSSDDDWCEIKGILGEREVDGQIQYLVDWKDHPTTGEVYPHEWKIQADLSKESIAHWEQTKRRETTSPLQGSNQSDKTNKADDSQEPRPACQPRRSSLPLGKRPRPKTTEPDSGDEDSEDSRSQKRLRLSSELSAGSAPSFTTSTSTNSEQPDSPPAQTHFQVILDHKSDFDPAEYQSIHLSQSTAQHYSSQSVSALESQDQNIILSTGHSQGTIPDSQEPSSLETQQSRSSRDGLSPYIVIPDSLPRYPGTQTASSGDLRQGSDSIPSHQPGHEFQPQSRIEMSTPRNSQGLPILEDPTSRGEGSSSSNTANAFLTQPAQQAGGPGLDSISTDFSTSVAADAERIRREMAELSSSDDDNGDEDNEKDPMDGREAIPYPDEAVTIAPAMIESAQPPAEIPVLPSIDLSGTMMPGLQPDSDSRLTEDSSFRPSSPQMLTLPILANRRSHYNKTIEDLRSVIDNWRKSFEDYQAGHRSSPNAELSSFIDEMFHRLEDLCDYGACEPSEESNLPSLKDRVNWWSSANSKFNFLHELLKGLAGGSPSPKTFRIAIVADAEHLLSRLCDLSEFLGVAYTCEHLDKSYSGKTSAEETSESRVYVTLSLRGEPLDIWAADIVITYSTRFNESDLATDLRDNAEGRTRPLVLQLAIAMSIEHVENEIFQLDRDLDESEHRYALLCGVVYNRGALSHPPDFMDVEDEPQRLAGELCQYLLGAADFSDIGITPWPLQHPIQQLLESSQLSQQEPDGGRKRPRAGTEIDVEEAKRLRRHSRPSGQPRSIPLTSELREFLEESGWRGTAVSEGPHITLPLAVLQDIKARFIESERATGALEEEIVLHRELIQNAGSRDEDQAFYDRTSEELRRALSDRTAAEEAAKAAKESFEKKELSLDKEKDKLHAKIQILEEENQRLQSNTGTVESEKLRREAEEKLKRAESRLETAQSNEAYMRDQYHNMSSDVGERGALERQIEELRKQAEERTIEIQKMNNEHSNRALLSQIAALEAGTHHQQLEIIRLYEENRQLKNEMNNRRQTRQGSQPRSPRPGLMSPRARNQLNSREASPVMSGMFPPMNNGSSTGMQYTSQNGQGGARWASG